jgi:hypothetical protein
MKKIIYLIIILFGSTSLINAAEKRDCSGLKKLSKNYIACKAGNIGAGIGAVGSGITDTSGKIIKGVGSGIASTGGKIIRGTGDTVETGTKSSKEGIFKSFSKIFSSSTKQYPRGYKN